MALSRRVLCLQTRLREVWWLCVRPEPPVWGPSLTERKLRRYVAGMRYHREYAGIVEAKNISMLHEEVLYLLDYFGARSKGVVMEIGSYVGGSTVVLARAAGRRGTGPIISVEKGGRHNHPEIPSVDIFRDLQMNLQRFGVSSQVLLLNGTSKEPRILQKVKETVVERGIDLLLIDADGHVERDFDLYAEFLNDQAVLVLDDYSSPLAPEKVTLVKDWVDQAVSSRRVTSLGVWGWGTWIGMHRRTVAS
jgi:predicted O-methyltransferase YrrM